MTGAIRLVACAALAAVLILTGCSALEPYPREITDIGESADYPLSAAGFTRTGVFELSADKPDFAIHYRLCQVDSVPYAEIVSTIRITRVSGTTDSEKSRFYAAIREIEGSGFGGELLEERSLVISKDGKKYVALMAAYSANAYLHACIIGEIPVPTYFEVIIWRYEDTIISLESSALPENQDIAPAKNLELLDAVNWTVLPF